MAAIINHEARVPAELSLERLDRVAASLFPQFSRSRLQQWIQRGELTVDGMVRPIRYKVGAGASLKICAAPDVLDDLAEAIDLNIIHEDEQVLVLNKPAGLVVHPGAGNRTGTMLNALLHHSPELEVVPRAGIVHRLDKDTTGLMVVARTIESQNNLVDQLSRRSVSRRYEAVVYGVLNRRGSVDAPIGRDPRNRTRMAAVLAGKEAITHYEPLKHFRHYSHVALALETGRTHQIRVHMQYLGYPLVGDVTYGGQFRQPADPDLAGALKEFKRQALHARELAFIHPGTGLNMRFEAPPPEDMADLLDVMQEHDAS